jgi:hypothetical protein
LLVNLSRDRWRKHLVDLLRPRGWMPARIDEIRAFEEIIAGPFTMSRDAIRGEATGMEQEANRFATDCLVPRARQAELHTLPITQAAVEAFAAELGLHPGIVVGQLQHLGRVDYAHALTKLKARYELAA